jgi:glyoxalase family protein
MQPIQGLHHITAVASDAQANVDFYERVLGQRLVKTTVNFDDPGTYHLYYGDEVGTPGTVMTFFPWSHMSRGRPGNGETAEVLYAIPRGSLGYWAERLASMGVEVGDVEARFGEQVLLFEDPDGMRLGLVETEDPATLELWDAGPVPAEYALRGFHGVTLWLDATEATATVLTEQMGYRHVGTEGERSRYAGASEDRALYVDLLARPGRPRGAFGAGSIHHIAFRTVDDEEQLEYRDRLVRSGLAVTPVQDRQYFHSIYFREPGGVLFEVATDAPGFLYDEPIETLGDALKLPSWLESRRAQIEPRLAPITRRGPGGVVRAAEAAE